MVNYMVLTSDTKEEEPHAGANPVCIMDFPRFVHGYCTEVGVPTAAM